MSNEISSDVEYLINQLDKKNKNENILNITYGNELINGTNRLTKEETANQPIIQINKQFQPNQFLTLVMIDPDAPSSTQPITGPFIHWILANFKENHGNDGTIICPYMGPGPRPGTGTHRYIFLLYQSNQQIQSDAEYDDIPKRRKFPLENLVNDYKLELVDITNFTVDA